MIKQHYGRDGRLHIRVKFKNNIADKLYSIRPAGKKRISSWEAQNEEN